MTIFFDLAYALVIFLAVAVAGVVPGFALGIAVPRDDRRLLVPAAALAVAGWIWAGWLGNLYGISRLGLLVFTAIGAVGFVYGWAAGLRVAARARARRSRRSSSPR